MQIKFCDAFYLIIFFIDVVLFHSALRMNFILSRKILLLKKILFSIFLSIINDHQPNAFDMIIFNEDFRKVLQYFSCFVGLAATLY